MPGGNAGFVAKGNISPSVFVKGDTATDNGVLQATAGAACVGVSGQNTRRAPYGGLDDGYHAITGEGCRVFQQNQVAPLMIGSAVTRFDRLKAGSGGKAVTASTGDSAYAIALQSGGADGVIIEAVVIMDTVGAS